MLAQQLSAHRANVVSRSSNALLLERGSKSQASLLFTPQEASEYDVRELYELALTGAEELRGVFPGASMLRQELLSAEMLALDRYALTQEEVSALDAKVDRQISALAEYFLHRGAQKVLEFMVRHLQIHLHNVDAILTAFLPFHETPLFRKVVCLPLDVKGSKWAFLVNLQQRKQGEGEGEGEGEGVALPRPALVKSMVATPFVLKDMLEHFVGYPTPTATSFCTVLLVEFIHACPKHRLETEIVPFVLPVLLKALRAKQDVDLQCFAYITTAALASKVVFTRKPASLLMLVSLKYAGIEAITPALTCATVVCSRAGLAANDLSEKVVNLFVKRSEFWDMLADVHASHPADARAFGSSLAVALCRNGHTSAVKAVLSKVELSQPQLAVLVAEIVNAMEPSKSGDTTEMASLLRHVAILAPKVVDDALGRVLEKEASDENNTNGEKRWAKLLHEAFAVGTHIRHLPMNAEGKRTTLFLGLVHAKATVRLAALQTLDAQLEEDTKLETTFERALVDRISDEEDEIALEALKVASRCVSPDIYLDAIASAVQMKKLRLAALKWLQRSELANEQLLPILVLALPPFRRVSLKRHWRNVLSALQRLPLCEQLADAETVSDVYSTLAGNVQRAIGHFEYSKLPALNLKAFGLLGNLAAHLRMDGGSEGEGEWALPLAEEVVKRISELMEVAVLRPNEISMVVEVMEKVWTAVAKRLSELHTWQRLLLPLARSKGPLDAVLAVIQPMYLHVSKQQALDLTTLVLASAHAEDDECAQSRLLLLCTAMVGVITTTNFDLQSLEAAIPYMLPALTSQHEAVRNAALDAILCADKKLSAMTTEKRDSGRRVSKSKSRKRKGDTIKDSRSSLTPLLSRLRKCSTEIRVDASALPRLMEEGDAELRSALTLVCSATLRCFTLKFTAAATTFLRTLRAAPDLTLPVAVECARYDLLPQLSLAIAPWAAEGYRLNVAQMKFVLEHITKEPVQELLLTPHLGRQVVREKRTELVKAVSSISAQPAVDLVRRIGLPSAAVIAELGDDKPALMKLLNAGLADETVAQEKTRKIPKRDSNATVSALLQVLKGGGEVDVVVVALLNAMERGNAEISPSDLQCVLSAMTTTENVQTKTLLVRLVGECLKSVDSEEAKEAAFIQIISEVRHVPDENQIVIMESVANLHPPTTKALHALVDAVVNANASEKRRMSVLAGVVDDAQIGAIARDLLMSQGHQGVSLLQTLLMHYSVKAQLSTLLVLVESFQEAWKERRVQSKSLGIIAFVAGHLRTKAFVKRLLALTTEEVEQQKIHGEKGFLGLLTRVLDLIHAIQSEETDGDGTPIQSKSDATSDHSGSESEEDGDEDSEGDDEDKMEDESEDDDGNENEIANGPAKQQNEKTQGERMLVLEELESIVERINGLLSVPMFVVVVSDLLHASNVHVRRLGLLQLAKKMEHHEDAWDDAERVLFLDMLEPLASLITSAKSSASEKQTALLCVEILARHLGEGYPEAFAPVFAAVVDLFCTVDVAAARSDPDSLDMISSICLCLATLVNAMPTEVVQHVNRLFPQALAALEVAGDRLENLSQAASSAVYVTASAAHQFLSPFLPKLLTVLSAPSSASMSLNVRTLELLGLAVSPRIIAPAIANVAKDVDLAQAPQLLKVVECVVEGLSPSSVREHVGSCVVMFVALLGRVEADAAMDVDKVKSYHQVHEQLASCVVAFAMLLNEKQLEELFDALVARVEQETSALRLSIAHFHGIMAAMTDRLGAIFLPFVERVYSLTVDHWIACQKPSKMFALRGAVSSAVLKHLTGFCRQVSRLNLSTSTSDSPMSQERFEEMMPLVLEEAYPPVKASKKRKREAAEGTAEQIPEDVKSLVIEFIRAQADQTNWQTFHHALLARGRKSMDVQTKLRMLTLCRHLFEEIGDEYLTLLADTLPTLAEMMDDESQSVRTCAIATAKKVEQLSGEDLSRLLDT